MTRIVTLTASCPACGACNWSGPLLESIHKGKFTICDQPQVFRRFDDEDSDRDWLRWTCSCGNPYWTRPNYWREKPVLPENVLELKR